MQAIKITIGVLWQTGSASSKTHNFTIWLGEGLRYLLLFPALRIVTPIGVEGIEHIQGDGPIFLLLTTLVTWIPQFCWQHYPDAYAREYGWLQPPTTSLQVAGKAFLSESCSMLLPLSVKAPAAHPAFSERGNF